MPLDGGDRIVSIVNWDATTNRRETRVLDDFVAWRERLTAGGARRRVPDDRAQPYYLRRSDTARPGRRDDGRRIQGRARPACCWVFWIPFQTTPSAHERRQGPRIIVFGRLAPGRTADDAQAELTVIGRQTAAGFPRTHELEREIGIRAALGADPLRIVRSIFAHALPSLNVQAPLSLNARTPE